MLCKALSAVSLPCRQLCSMTGCSCGLCMHHESCQSCRKPCPDSACLHALFRNHLQVCPVHVLALPCIHMLGQDGFTTHCAGPAQVHALPYADVLVLGRCFQRMHVLGKLILPARQ
jgi:hypothetical protein